MNKNYHMPINNSFMLPKKIHVIEMHSRSMSFCDFYREVWD